MKTILRNLRFIAVVALILVANASSFAQQPVDKERDLQLKMIQSAAGVGDLHFIDIPVNAPVASCHVFAQGYKQGKVAFDSTQFSKSSMASDPPARTRMLKICTCLRANERATYDPASKTPCHRVPGTGSTKIGIAFHQIQESGLGGTGEEIVIEHKEFDFHYLRSRETRDLPFTIVARHLPSSAVPFLVYLPHTFDPQTLKGEVDALTLPEGTLVLYASIETKNTAD